jgi:hypothetical protein
LSVGRANLRESKRPRRRDRGVVALLLERRPNASPSEVRKWLVATAAPLGGGARPDEFGAGLVDAACAAAAAEAAAAKK